ncbi:hypothetical protein [Stenotrophomonas sp. Marseille-Q5258]|uniref:hypothetical protein n=1 Tax=Stenotrophomonas sp. Marseille-Q5258 TaxID=2972779 RepID=UPI0021C9D023|nr:hypothetical protein [Stenotrophomonas sp. Marseille-Q5258]
MSIARRLATAALLTLVLSAQAAANCSDRADLLVSPVAGVSLMFTGTTGQWVSLLGPQIYGEGDLRVPALRPAVVDLKEGKLGFTDGQVVYLEPDGKGGKRVCRTERWESRVYQPLNYAHRDGTPDLRRDRDNKVRAVPYRRWAGQERNPILAKLTPYYYMARVDAYFYDQGGHLVEARVQETEDVNALRQRYPKELMIDRLTFCARYNAQGQLIWTTGGMFESLVNVPGAQCAGLQTGEVDSTSYRYYADGKLLSELRVSRGSDVSPRTSQRDASKQGEWSGGGTAWSNVHVPQRERSSVHFIFTNKKGITRLYAENMGLAAYDAQPPYKELLRDPNRKLRYDFPQPVPLSVVDDHFATLDKYPRVRRYPHQSGLNVIEFFDGNSRTPRLRQWRSVELSRQETYNAEGKLVQVIYSGGRALKVYPEDLRRYAESGVLKVTPTRSGYASYRVYTYDASGKESLTFVCWQHDVPSNRPLHRFPWWTPDPAPTPTRGREAALIYGMKNVANRCGRPDGTMLIQGMGPINTYMATQFGYDVEQLVYDKGR